LRRRSSRTILLLVLPAEIERKLGRALACSACAQTTDTSAYFGFEDVLTSNVFGALRYLEPSFGLDPVLGGLGVGSMARARVDFWRQIDGCEPDVIIDLGHAVVIVETKLHAEFGWEQLPREVLYANEQAAGRPWRLLCVTDHLREPMHHTFAADGQPAPVSKAPLGDAVASYFAYQNATGLTVTEIANRVCWMSWAEIASRLDAVRLERDPPPHARALLDDLLRSLDARGLTRRPFVGFGHFPGGPLAWSHAPIWAATSPEATQPTALTWTVPPLTAAWTAREWFSESGTRFGGFAAHADAGPMSYPGWFLSRGSNG